MEKEIRFIKEMDYETAHALQCEYLDRETFEDFLQRVKSDPDLYFVTVDGSEVVGVCYGSPSKKNEAVINLNGIAVNLDHSKNYARVGLGTNLLLIFEKAVKQRGYNKIGVGSADDPKVEAFYLKNGFKPTELVVIGSNHEEMDRIRVNDFESGILRREELRRSYNPREVIFILEKYIE
ncbi:GNAT family N-acetyltransferase [Paenibacillus sp. OV219]|uniref:GNAT family N-acetyltransferase n=1 Tax=Paenibacillus sp. OV219 TaxID=1884377 RepID=UPI0008CF917C|nr:GNAT family N-acetyltransferase [Paenibacillus sp. OV219]SEM79514.1 Acetyltransferase (GNAT) domain-containing protein [Paenibacillus sp. OV219]